MQWYNINLSPYLAQPQDHELLACKLPLELMHRAQAVIILACSESQVCRCQQQFSVCFPVSESVISASFHPRR